MWYGADVRILYAMMGILQHFVEKEIAHKLADPELFNFSSIGDEQMDRGIRDSLSKQYSLECEAKAIYDWWINEYPNYGKLLTKALIFSSEAWFAEEDRQRKRENEMMKRLIDIRESITS